MQIEKRKRKGNFETISLDDDIQISDNSFEEAIDTIRQMNYTHQNKINANIWKEFSRTTQTNNLW